MPQERIPSVLEVLKGCPKANRMEKEKVNVTNICKACTSTGYGEWKRICEMDLISCGFSICPSELFLLEPWAGWRGGHRALEKSLGLRGPVRFPCQSLTILGPKLVGYKSNLGLVSKLWFQKICNNWIPSWSYEFKEKRISVILC